MQRASAEPGLGFLWKYEDGSYLAIATLGVTPTFAETSAAGPTGPGGPTTGVGLHPGQHEADR